MVIRKEKLDFLKLEDIDSTSKGIVIMPITDFLRAKANQNTLHVRAFYSLLFVQSGELSMVVDQNVHVVGAHDMISINADAVCSFESHADVEGYVVLFKASFFMQRHPTDVMRYFHFLKSRSMHTFVLSKEERTSFLQVVSLMLTAYNSFSLSADYVLKRYLIMLFQMLGRYIVVEGVDAHMDEVDDRIRNFESLVDNHYAQQRYPSFYAGQLNISINYLNRICREKRAASCGTIIRGRILVEAERLLYHTFKTVKEIAFELGFENAPYFSTFFKANKGMSPEEYRKNL
ncbi:MAG: helix-turn-helix domain-containing protein [Sphingobacterium sp.]|jgi:AraC-like DNA-binding protein|uniref:helix-turn-helix domain-containing protein n=1 Tax=Sphingobacterium sp. TaxID=341027 RepID=UPI0028520C3B|nr:helix-turn-helix domain-containing protein [Sphingobacterium sp.]MDR3008334.1 helix-turn-helix domain-containing protein [Sphingobacterium sp.]